MLRHILSDDSILSPKIVASTDIPSISVRCPFLIVESRSFLLSPRRHCHPIAPAFTPIATKGFEYRRFWWSGALRNLIVEATRERTNTSLFFPRRHRLAFVYRKNPIRRLLLFPRVALIAHHRRHFPYSPSVLSPLKEISRLFQFPLILLADRRAPEMILYFIPRVSYGYVVYTDFERARNPS